MTLDNISRTVTTSSDQNYQCRFCQRHFRRETSLTSHVCEQKKRFQSRTDLGVQLAMQAYLRFYQYTQPSGRVRDWDDFATSPYYRAFVKFGNYCHNTPVIAPMQYLDWLLKKNKKIDHWDRDSVYGEFLIPYLLIETVEDALCRSIKWSQTWGEQNQAAEKDCLRYGNVNAICHAVMSGKLSAWAIYNCASGRQFLNKLSSEQLSMIYDYVNPEIWQRKFLESAADTDYCQEILQQAGW